MSHTNAKRFSALMSQMRARLYCIVEGSCIPDEKQKAIKKQVRDVTTLMWDEVKVMIKENNK